MPVGSGLSSQHQAIGPHARPVCDTVVTPPVDLELLAQVLQQVSAIKDTQEILSKHLPNGAAIEALNISLRTSIIWVLGFIHGEE